MRRSVIIMKNYDDDENRKNGYIFHIMRICIPGRNSQAFILIFSIFLFSCEGKPEELPIIPPPTNPMSREYIGYGVINVSFIHVTEEPSQTAASVGFLRKRTVAKILERRSLNNRGNIEIWVKIDTESTSTPDGNIQGWLRENTIDIYDNEVQAITASEIMTP